MDETVDLAVDEKVRAVPLHRWVAHVVVLLRLLVEKELGTAALPVLPAVLLPPPPPEHDSDLDELRRILADNPALIQGIRTGDFVP